MVRGKGVAQKGSLGDLNKGSPYLLNWFRRDMERFEVKRGVIKSMGSNAGLAKLATQHFNDVEVNEWCIASFAILTSVTAEYTNDGKLQVDVEQMKGDDPQPLYKMEEGKQCNPAKGGQCSSTRQPDIQQSKEGTRLRNKQRNSQRLAQP